MINGNCFRRMVDTTLSAPAVLVVGPMGAGKSTFIAIQTGAKYEAVREEALVPTVGAAQLLSWNQPDSEVFFLSHEWITRIIWMWIKASRAVGYMAWSPRLRPQQHQSNTYPVYLNIKKTSSETQQAKITRNPRPKVINNKANLLKHNIRKTWQPNVGFIPFTVFRYHGCLPDHRRPEAFAVVVSLIDKLSINRSIWCWSW